MIYALRWTLISLATLGCSSDGDAPMRQTSSPGKASITFTAVGSYCMTSQCGEGPSIDIEDSSGHSLFTVSAGCTSVSCDTCTTSPCPGFACQMIGIAVSGATLDWDGRYNVTSSCGSGTSCVTHTYASPGKYTAKMCATPGTLAGSDGGDQQCVTSGPPKCGSVVFDFPSTTPVAGTIGP